MDWLLNFFKVPPSLGFETLGHIKRFLDTGFRSFTRHYGDSIESFFNPLKAFLLFFEHLLINTPWPIIILSIGLLTWLAARSWKIVLGSIVSLCLVAVFGLWEDTMKTLAMIIVATLIALILGIPIGVVMSKSPRLNRVMTVVLDVMQTMPSFVYLIPVVVLLGIGRVPGLIAVVIYAIPPVIRFTDLGIRLVAKDLVEAADSFGSSSWQKIIKVQMPLALPTIMGGINQTIMMALSMVVVAAMIGVQGLGQSVLRSISNQYFTLGMLSGLAIVTIAIIFDRASQAYGKRLQKHLEVSHDE